MTSVTIDLLNISSSKDIFWQNLHVHKTLSSSFTVCCYHLHLNPIKVYVCKTCGQYTWTFILLFLDKIYRKRFRLKTSRQHMRLAFITHVFIKNLSTAKMCNRLTWHNVQWKWLIWSPVPAVDWGSIEWGSCSKAQGWNQAILASVIADNNCLKVPPERWTSRVHCDLSNFISPENNISSSTACEGDFLRETSISSRDTASQTDQI